MKSCWRGRNAIDDRATKQLDPGQGWDLASRLVEAGLGCQSLDQIRKAGFEKFLKHHTGHGIGLEGHEAPWIAEGDISPALVAATFVGSSFSFSFPTSSASTSFVSRCTGPRDFVRFDVGSLFFPELLCFFKVDLLSRFDCTLECVDHR